MGSAAPYQLPYVPDTDPANVGNRPGDGPLRPGGVAISGIPTDQKNLPSTLSPAAAKQQNALTIVRDVWGGTETVRARQNAYLPQAPGEEPQNYQARLKGTVFFNAFRSAIEGLTGFVFRRDPMFGDDVPAQIRGDQNGKGGHWENIDNAGTHGDVFIREALQEALETGHCAILVDYPDTTSAIIPRMPNGKPTREADLTFRPYWVLIKKDNIISWRTTTIAGRLVLTQLVVKETTSVADGAFGEKEQIRYRVHWRNDAGQCGFQLLEITDTKTVIEVDRGLYVNQTEIPIAEVTTSGRRGLFDSDPPLIDLAYVNIAFYQRSSDQSTSIHKTCVPVLAIIGASSPATDNKTAVVVGPDTVLWLPLGADAKYVSHDGAALNEVKVSLDDMKNDMGVLGLSMLAPQRRAAETAQAKRIDKSASDSKLAVTARGLQDAVERALQFHARYLGLSDGGSIEINREFDDMSMQADMMTAWATLATALNLPVRIVLEALQDGQRLTPDENIDALVGEIAANKAADAAARQDELAAQLALKQQAPPKPVAA
jgi:hypothetical protein